MTDGTARARDVREIQEYLRYLQREQPALPLLAVDGLYGPETAEAVRAFQRGFGLPVTGEVDTDTWEKLVAEYRRRRQTDSAPTALRVFLSGDWQMDLGDVGPRVVILQAMLDLLREEYALPQPVVPTGVYDRPTGAAVTAFQAIFGFEQTGRVDRRTWEGLALAFNRHVGR